MNYAARSDKGLIRSNNEDYFYADDQQGIYLVADGIGGHNAGEVASKMATEVFVDYVREHMKNEGHLIPKIIREAFNVANEKVYHMAKENQELSGMGTTLTVVVIAGDLAYFGQIGDSRGYVMSGSHLRQITFDHTLVNELLKLGSISEEDARIYPSRNIITKALGTDSKIMPDIFEVNLKDQDVIFLCSDGISDLVDDGDIGNVIEQQKDLDVAAEQLVKMALKNGGYDNITVLLYRVEKNSEVQNHE